MKTFEELLAAFENATTDLDSEPSGSANFGGYRETYRAARLALVEYVRERTTGVRVHADRNHGEWWADTENAKANGTNATLILDEEVPR